MLAESWMLDVCVRPENLTFDLNIMLSIPKDDSHADKVENRSGVLQCPALGCDFNEAFGRSKPPNANTCCANKHSLFTLHQVKQGTYATVLQVCSLAAVHIPFLQLSCSVRHDFLENHQTKRGKTSCWSGLKATCSAPRFRWTKPVARSALKHMSIMLTLRSSDVLLVFLKCQSQAMARLSP